MSHLYEKLLELRNLPDAYKDWKEYREKITEYIINNTLAESSVLIIGAGNCNDMDLGRLAGHFSMVTLLDMDAEGMERAINRYGVSSQKVSTVRCNILGIADEEYINLEKMASLLVKSKLLDNEKSCPEMVTLFTHAMEKALVKRSLDNIKTALKSAGLESGFDHVVCIGVHSQLNNLFCQMAEVYGEYVKFDINEIYRKASEQNEIIAKVLDEIIAELSDKSFILGLEEERGGMDGAVEGAYQAICDIENGEYDILNETKLVWPFNVAEKKYYNMKIITAKKSIIK